AAGPLVIAHRAAMGHAPENTLAGVRAGLRLGADAIEVDAQLCADGVPVLMHDSDLDRTTSGRGPVAEAHLAELSLLNAGQGEPVPTLEQALDLVARRADLVVELKGAAGSDPANLAARVVDVVRLHGLERHVWLWSFGPAILASLTAIARDIRIVHLCQEPDAAVVSRALRLGLAGVAFTAESATDAAVEQLRREGLDTFVWTVNEPAQLRRLLQLHLTGIVTDYPERLRAAFDEAGCRGANGRGLPGQSRR
ncbi:MAG: glycerophosphodiester phosphodiesterase, partial [Dehalococcoidia bacterium]